MAKVCVIVVWIGELPGYLGLWWVSARRNSGIDFYLLTNAAGIESEGNIKVIRIGMEEINRLALLTSERLAISSPYKLCDYKPLYGELFPEIAMNYQYWGWSDLDVVYGNFMDTLGPSLKKYDYVATGENAESGPLALLRNDPRINRLWRLVPDVHRDLNSKQVFGIDERGFLSVLKQEAQCDLVLRECLHDLPARWIEGELVSLRSGRRYTLYHFGGPFAPHRTQIARRSHRLVDAMRSGRPIRVGRGGSIFVEADLGDAQLISE